MSLNPPPARQLLDQTRHAIELAELLVARDQHLTDQTRRMIERDCAAVYLADLLNADRKLSAWALAEQVRMQLSRFEIARRRIEAGSREPRNDAERHLLALCRADCALSRRRIWDLLVGLRLGC